MSNIIDFRKKKICRVMKEGCISQFGDERDALLYRWLTFNILSKEVIEEELEKGVYDFTEDWLIKMQDEKNVSPPAIMFAFFNHINSLFFTGKTLEEVLPELLLLVSFDI